MIFQWVAIGVLILIGLILLRMEHQTRKVKVVVIIILGFLIYISIVSLFSSENVDINSPRGVANAVYVYFGWMGRTIANLWDIGVNTTKDIGNAVKFNNSKSDKTK